MTTNTNIAPTRIHFGLPQNQNQFGENTIHLFEPIAINQMSDIDTEIEKALQSQSLSTLENALKNLLCKEQTPQKMSMIIAALGKEPRKELLFKMLLKNMAWQKALLQNSYMHDNGFEKWVLLSTPYYKLRLHVYEDTRLIPQENRHNHSWDFASYIMEGCLQNTIYTPDEVNGEEELLHYQYSPVKGDEYSTSLIEKARLRKMTDINLSAGTAYFMPAEVIHRISYENTFKQRTVTLMLTGNRKNYHCDLYAEQAFKEVQNSAKRFTEKDIQNRFQQLLAA